MDILKRTQDQTSPNKSVVVIISNLDANHHAEPKLPTRDAKLTRTRPKLSRTSQSTPNDYMITMVIKRLDQSFIPWAMQQM
jgi:hypothetical protein